MAKAWNEVAASPGYQALPLEEQQAAQRQYFDAVVAPKVPEAERNDAWSQFSEHANGDRQPVQAPDTSRASPQIDRSAAQGAPVADAPPPMVDQSPAQPQPQDGASFWDAKGSDGVALANPALSALMKAHGGDVDKVPDDALRHVSPQYAKLRESLPESRVKMLLKADADEHAQVQSQGADTAPADDTASRPTDAPPPNADEGVGMAKGLAREATEGATFGWGDEIGLGGAALAAKAAQKLGVAPDTGQSLGEIYDDMRSHYDSERKQFSDEHPVASTAANIAGGVATGGLGGAGIIGKAAQAGKLATAGALAGTGAVEGALAGAGNADEGERLKGAAEGGAVGAVAAPAGAAVVGGAARTLAKRGAVKDVEKLVPSRDDLHDAAQSLYDQADQLGVTLKPVKVGLIGGRLRDDAKALGFRDRIHPRVADALDSFKDLQGGAPTLANMEQQRRILAAAAKSPEPDERRIASQLIDRYDDLIQNLKPTDVKSGDATQAGELLGQARGLWSRQAKLGTIEDAVERAKNQATGFENGLRVQFRKILDNPKKVRGFTDEEKDAMQRIVRGDSTSNTLRLLGRLGFSEKGATNIVGASFGAAGGAAVGGPAGAVAVPLLGQAARKGAAWATQRNVESLQRLVAAGANPSYIVNRYATLAGKAATPNDLAKYLVTAPKGDLLELAGKLNNLKGPNRKLAHDALVLSLTQQAAGNQAAPNEVAQE
ncbi:MAG: hypothetical protein QM661_09730 [Solimonas sp.]